MIDFESKLKQATLNIINKSDLSLYDKAISLDNELNNSFKGLRINAFMIFLILLINETKETK